MDERFTISRRLEEANAGRAFALRVFGDEIAKREGYKVHQDLDAVHLYLCQKHNWLPSVVKSLSLDDMLFLLEEEMNGWTYPPEARSSSGK